MNRNVARAGTAAATRQDCPARLDEPVRRQPALREQLGGCDFADDAASEYDGRPACGPCSGRPGDIHTGPRLELTTPRIDSEMPCPTCGHVLTFDEVWGLDAHRQVGRRSLRPAQATDDRGGDRPMSSTNPALAWAPDDPIRGRLVFVSGVGLPSTVDQLTPALEVYGGGCIPQLRERLGDHPEYRARIRILCAGHGVLHADTEMLADRRRMTERRRDEIKPKVEKTLLAEFGRDGVPREVLVMAEHPYAGLIDFIFHIPGLLPHSALHSPIPDLTWGWAAAVLDRWGWP